METATVARRPLPRVVIIPLVLVIALGLSLASAQTAAAFTTAPAIAPSITRTIAKSAVSKVFCLGGPIVCGVATLGTLAYAAYSTRESWLPMFTGGAQVPNLGSGGGSFEPGLFEGSVAAVELIGRDSPYPGGQPLTIQHSSPDGGLINAYIRGTCRNTLSGGFAATSGDYNGGTSSTPSTFSRTLCGSDSELVALQMWPKSTHSVYRTFPQFNWSASAVTDAPNLTRTTVTCKNAAGSVEVAVRDTTDGSIVMPSCTELFGPDYAPESWTVGTGWDPSSLRTVIREELDSASQALYPDCTGLGNPGCVLEVRVDGAPCTVGDPACTNWALKQITAPDRYQCMWGPYSMPISDCAVLERAYQEAPSTTNTGNGVVTVTDPSEIDGDPSTNVGSPAPGGGTTTGELTLPDEYPGNYPGAAGAPDASADAETHECWPSGWGMLNPVQWVLQPIRCAFIPSEGLQPRVERVQTVFADSPPAVFANSLFGASSPWGSGVAAGGCPDWSVSVAGYEAPVLCGTPFSDAMVGARGWLAAGFIGAAFAPLARGFLRGSMPIIKPTGGD